MWVLDYLEDIASDLSVFHRVDDPMALSSSRYFLWAERLPAYEGAVRAALLRDTKPPVVGVPDGLGAAPPAEPPTEVSPAALAAMSDHPGFPSIEFTGG